MRTIKESSDELNPSVVTPAFIVHVPGRRTVSDYLALGVATCGVGFIPFGPGTWGSVVGVGLYVLARSIDEKVFTYAAMHGWGVPPLEAIRTAIVLVMLFGITIAGIWAATRAESILARKDPGVVVIDEVVGQLIAFLFVPPGVGVWAIITGFIAFRAFDIWKPYPIRRLEALESGLGIMADDVLAGIYAAMLMSLLTPIYLLL